MQHLPITARLLIDLKPFAHQLEALAGPALRPYPVGFYTPQALKPVLVPGGLYFRRLNQQSSQLVPYRVNTLEDVTADVFDHQGQCLVMHRFKKELTDQPAIPIHGVGMCMEFIESIVDSHAAWSNRKMPKMNELWDSFFIPEFVLKVIDGRERYVGVYSGNEEFITPLTERLIELSNMVRQFLGDDPWIMHFVKPMGGDVLIEQGLDFRIHDWTQRMAKKEWT